MIIDEFMNPLPKEAGHVFVIHGKPKDYLDLQVISWALEATLHQTEYSSQNQDISDVVEAAFVLPYQQGAGFTELYLAQVPPGNEEAALEPPTWVDEPSEAPTFTGHWIRFGYTDSMTSIFTSRIFDAGDGHYIVEDY